MIDLLINELKLNNNNTWTLLHVINISGEHRHVSDVAIPTTHRPRQL